MTKRQPFDVCACGDYRHQHEGGVGRCKLGSLCTPTPCQQFRFFRTATEKELAATHGEKAGTDQKEG